MANNAVRSGVVLLVAFGIFALAIPYVSGLIDAWLFADTSASSATSTEVSDQTQDQVRPVVAAESNDSQAADFAFSYEEDASRSSVARTSFQEPVGAQEAFNAASPSGIEQLQQRLQYMGAAHLIVERSGNQFECRTLIPIAPESSYQKAFSATASSPEAAMEQVIAEVQVWQRSSRR